jgi:hypothetical protein
VSSKNDEKGRPLFRHAMYKYFRKCKSKKKIKPIDERLLPYDYDLSDIVDKATRNN